MLVIKFFYKIRVFLFKLCILVVKCEAKDFRSLASEEDIKRVPYTISLTTDCTGALINPQWVITAAHCIVGYKWEDESIRLGAIDWTKSNYNLNIEKVYVHPQYRKKKHFLWRSLYDIAVIKLAQPAVLSESIQILQLAETEWPSGVNMRECTLAGFGWNIFLHDDPILRITTFNFTRGCDCIKDRNLICTITANDGDVSPCFGDSGGVVVCDNEGVAIISHLVKNMYCNKKGTRKYCSSKGGLALCTYIHQYLPWIKNILQYEPDEPDSFLNSKAIGVRMKGIQYFAIIPISVQLFGFLIIFS